MTFHYIISTAAHDKLLEEWEAKIEDEFSNWLDSNEELSSNTEELIDLIKFKNIALLIMHYKEGTLLQFSLDLLNQNYVNNPQPVFGLEEKTAFWNQIDSEIPELEVMDKFNSYYDEDADEDEWEKDEDGILTPPYVTEKVFYTIDELAKIYNEKQFIHPYLEVQGEAADLIKSRSKELENGQELESESYGNLAWSLDFEENNDFRGVI